MARTLSPVSHIYIYIYIYIHYYWVGGPPEVCVVEGSGVGVKGFSDGAENKRSLGGRDQGCSVGYPYEAPRLSYSLNS